MTSRGSIGPDPKGPGAIVSCCEPAGLGVAKIAAWPLRVHTEAGPLSSQLALDAAPAAGAKMMAAAAPARKTGANLLMAILSILSVVGCETLTGSGGFAFLALCLNRR